MVGIEKPNGIFCQAPGAWEQEKKVFTCQWTGAAGEGCPPGISRKFSEEKAKPLSKFQAGKGKKY